jgi:hypothetical protein
MRTTRLQMRVTAKLGLAIAVTANFVCPASHAWSVRTPAQPRVSKRAPSYLDVGKYLVAGTVSYSNTSYADDYERTLLNISAQAQRFSHEFFDRDYLALGARALYTRATDEKGSVVQTAFGPAATYYLGLQERLYLTGTQAVLLHAHVRDNFYFVSSTLVGLSYFLTPSVSFGPGIEFSHAFGTTDVIGYNTFDLSLGFAIYL